MSVTVSDIELGVLDRLEESIDDPMFWDVPGEIRPAIIEAMNEAVLITGDPIVRQAELVTLSAGTTLFTCPSDSVALVRLESGNGESIRRVSAWDLDRSYPGWQRDTGPQVKYWFPVGMTRFGIYPKLNAPISVRLSYVLLPVTTLQPYDGMEPVPFQTEFLDGLAAYAAHVARLKEGGTEFQQSIAEYELFLAKMQELSKLANRKNVIRFTRRGGIPAKVSEVTTQ